MQDILQFHQKFKIDYDGPERDKLPDELAAFRIKFLREELDELKSADTPEDELDALVDLTYVALGTMHLHGFTTISSDVLFDELTWLFNQSAEQEHVAALSYRALHDLIDRYEGKPSKFVLPPEEVLCFMVGVVMGFAAKRGYNFKEAWRRVHEANMKKMRVERAEDSKRGSIYDCVKPEGWRPADLSDLVG